MADDHLTSPTPSLIPSPAPHASGDGKWIDGLTPEMLIADAARLALASRFHVVRHFLPLAMNQADADVEHVHRLRVGTRRAHAALKIFAIALPDKVLKKARRCLRGIRRAAGEARDWDVFLIDLLKRNERAAEKERPGLDFLIGYSAAQRAAAQEHLVAAGQQSGGKLEKSTQHLLDATREPHKHEHIHSLGDLARHLLPDCLRELTQAGEQDLSDYEHLHRVRILGKQLRYAMEIVAPCFPLEFREVSYRQVEAMQDILGNANDSHVATGRD